MRIIETHSAGDGASDVVVNAITAGPAAVTSASFNGFGQLSPAGTPGIQIDLTNANADSRALRVTVSAGGAIRMCDPLVAASDTRACPPPP